MLTEAQVIDIITEQLEDVEDSLSEEHYKLLQQLVLIAWERFKSASPELFEKYRTHIHQVAGMNSADLLWHGDIYIDAFTFIQSMYKDKIAETAVQKKFVSAFIQELRNKLKVLNPPKEQVSRGEYLYIPPSSYASNGNNIPPPPMRVVASYDATFPPMQAEQPLPEEIPVPEEISDDYRETPSFGNRNTTLPPVRVVAPHDATFSLMQAEQYLSEEIPDDYREAPSFDNHNTTLPPVRVLAPHDATFSQMQAEQPLPEEIPDDYRENLSFQLDLLSHPAVRATLVVLLIVSVAILITGTWSLAVPGAVVAGTAALGCSIGGAGGTVLTAGLLTYSLFKSNDNNEYGVEDLSRHGDYSR